MKYSRRRLLGVLWLLLLAFLGFLLLRSCGSDRTAAAATNEQRVACLNSLGWQVEPEPVETLSLTLPKELEEPYLSYNVLQRAQGFDLEPCCGKTVERCTYTVKNHPSGKVCQADLYICGGGGGIEPMLRTIVETTRLTLHPVSELLSQQLSTEEPWTYLRAIGGVSEGIKGGLA